MRSKRTTTRNKNELPPERRAKKPRVAKQKNHKVGNAQKVIHDGIQFQSYLEKTMYNLFTENGFVYGKTFFYEKVFATLLEPFKIENEIWINKKSSKTFIMESKSVRKMIYTPDFTDSDDLFKAKWVVETKGNPNERWGLVFKLFKLWLSVNNPTCRIFVPCNKTQCEETIKMLVNETSN